MKKVSVLFGNSFRKQKKIVIMLLIVLFVFSAVFNVSPSNSVSASTSVQLLQDRSFSAGFRSEWAYGTTYTGDSNLKKGDCTAYRNISPYTITNIPGGTDSGKFWGFEEGAYSNLYHNFKDYEFISGAEGWVNGNSTSLSVSGGILNISITGSDPFIYSPDNLSVNANVNINGTSIKNSQYLYVRLRNTTSDPNMQIFFKTVGEDTWTVEKSKWVTIGTNMTGYAEYRIDMSTVSKWTGKIKQLRIDPVAGATSGTVYIDSIKLQRYVDELHENRFSANYFLNANTPSSLVFSQYNNFGLNAGDTGYNTKVMRSIQSDKNGKVIMYHNGLNSIRNIAINNGAEYANDTWPHMYLIQNFKNDIDIAQYEKINTSFNAKLTQMVQQNTWPSGIPGAATPTSDISVQFLIRDKENPYIAVFICIKLYSSSGNYTEYYSADQHGQGMYFDDAANYGGRLTLNTERTISFDAKKLIAKAIAKAQAQGSIIKPSPDNYRLSMMYFGVEDIGNYEKTVELSNVSVIGETGITYPNAWEFASGTDGWDNSPNQCTVTASNGKLNISINGTDPFTYSQWPISVNASANKLVRIKLKNNATSGDAWAKIYWTTNNDPVWNEGKSRAFIIKGSSSDYLEYVINMEHHSGWKDTVRQIRLDPINDGSATTGTINIDYIRISN